MNEKEDLQKAARHFWRLGFDCMLGSLCGGMNEWQERGNPISQIGTLSASRLRAKLSKEELTLVDVREPHEWKDDGYIDGAERIFFGHLGKKADSWSRDKPVAVTCSVGNRSSIGASILKRKEFTEVYNVLGGMTAWTNLGYPTKKND